MSRIFQNVTSPRPPRNNFNLSREVLTTGRIGNLIPVQCDLAVPGEFMKQDAEFLMRFAPLVGAAMARFNVHFHTFFVPLRLCTARDAETSGFEDFMLNVASSSEEIPILPRLVHGTNDEIELPNANSQAYREELTMQDFAVGSLWDYLGLPVIYNQLIANHPSVTLYPRLWPTKGISLMPFIAYQKIFNDWYRRDQIEKEVLLPRNCSEIDFDAELRKFSLPIDWNDTAKYEGVDGYDYTNEDEAREFCIKNLFRLRQRNYERDYFTASLPEPQFGDEVYMGGGTDSGVSKFIGKVELDNIGVFARYRGAGSTAEEPFFVQNSAQMQYHFGSGSSVGSTYKFAPVGTDTQTLTLTGDTTEFFPKISINDFRVAMQMQGVTEMLNRGGTRFKEFCNMIYHVDVPDARLQRVEYVGGFKAPVTIGTVVQTSETTENGTPLGTLAGKATAAGYDVLSKGKKLVWEHGFYMTLMSVTPRTSYFGGIPRIFSLTDPIDFYVPAFDRLGEDAVYTRELYSDIWDENGTSQDVNYDENEVFGYTPMYSYLKSSKSFVTGEFRTTLRDLHASRSFNKVPRLSPQFIKVMPEDFDRMFEFMDIDGTSNEHFYTEIVISQVAKKPMSKYSTPLTLM